MLELDGSIHVLYGENDVACWTILASLLTFASSLVIGVAAFRNGRTATRIAKEASDREEHFRNEERARVRSEKRHKAAAAMASAIWALDAAMIHSREDPGSAEAANAAERANVLKLQAVIELELLHPEESPAELIEWFEKTTKRFPKIPSKTPHQRSIQNRYRGEATGSVRRWQSRMVEVKDFLPPDRRLE